MPCRGRIIPLRTLRSKVEAEVAITGHRGSDRGRSVRNLWTDSIFFARKADNLVSAEPLRHAECPTATSRTHMFDLLCKKHGIDHRLTKPNHPWTNSPVERMNRTLKEATVKRDHYETRAQLRAHLDDFLAAYTFAKGLKTLRGLTPHEVIRKAWTDDPKAFTLNPLHHTAGPYI